MYMPLGIFGEESQPYSNMISCKVPADACPYGSKAMMMKRSSGREKHFSHQDPARALAIGRAVRGSDDLASTCRTWLSGLQGRPHAIASYHCRTAILHLEILSFGVALPVLQIPLEASTLSAGKRVQRPLSYPTPERIKNYYTVGFSAGDVKPSSWVHG